MPKKKTYIILVQYTEYTSHEQEIEVEAENREDAIQNAYDQFPDAADDDNGTVEIIDELESEEEENA